MQKCMAMHWDDLRIFYAIVRAGSLTAAAHRMGVNQSTVSRRLAALERSLGARVLNRRAGGVSLTAAGEVLLRRAEAIAEQFDQIEDSVAGRDTRLTGRLRVTCTDNFAYNFVILQIGRFLRMHPEIDVDLLTDYQHLSLARREADVAIRTTMKPSETLVGRRLFRIALAAYGSAELVAGMPPEPDPASLPWIGYPSEAYNRLMITAHFPTAAIRHRVESNLMRNAMARNGVGVAVTGCFAGDPDPALRRVYGEPITDADMDLWVLTHPDLVRVARVRAFMGFIADAFLVERELFEGRRPLAKAGVSS
jgi:molybdate transport repressor ModE-like protein